MESKEAIRQNDTAALKKMVEKEAWVALKRFFDGAKNAVEAKVSCIVIATLVKEEATRNNSRSLDLLERRLMMGEKKELAA